MNLPQARGGRLATRAGHAVVTVRCPECGAVHRYDEGPLDDPDVRARLGRGFVDEWMPCRADLPGNFYRVLLSPPRPAPAAARHAEGSPLPEANDGGAPRSRRRRRRHQKALPASGKPARPGA